MPKRLILAVLLSQVFFAHASESDDVIKRARAMIEQGEQMREAAEERFRVAEADCYKTFFVNRCLDRARSTRQKEVQAARELEQGGKRMELAERMRLATERQSAIDMRAGRMAPEPSAVTAAERQAREAELAKLPAAEREAIYARELAERLERRVREIQEQGAAATRAIIQPPAVVPAPVEAKPLPLSEEEATRIREEREQAAREAEAARQQAPAAAPIPPDEAERIRAEREAAAREAEERAAEERARRDAELERLRQERESALPPPAVEEPAAPALSDEEAARIRAEREEAAREAEARAAEERARRDAERARLRGEEIPPPAPTPEPVPEPVVEPAPEITPEPAPAVEPAPAAPAPETAPAPVPEAAPEAAPEVPVVLDPPPASSIGKYELLPETKNPPVLPGAPTGGPQRAEVIPLQDVGELPVEGELAPLAPLAPQ